MIFLIAMKMKKQIKEILEIIKKNNENISEKNKILIYNKDLFDMKKIIQFLMDFNKLKTQFRCNICNNIMKLNKNKYKKDAKIWRTKNIL